MHRVGPSEQSPPTGGRHRIRALELRGNVRLVRTLAKGGPRRRLPAATATATAVALSIPASVATVGVAGPAGTAGSSVSCSGLDGTITRTVTLSKWTPPGGTGYKVATGTATSLAWVATSPGGNVAQPPRSDMHRFSDDAERMREEGYRVRVLRNGDRRVDLRNGDPGRW